MRRGDGHAHRWHDAREIFDSLVRAASRRSSRDMYIYRVVMLLCRILIGAAVGLTALACVEIKILRRVVLNLRVDCTRRTG